MHDIFYHNSSLFPRPLLPPLLLPLPLLPPLYLPLEERPPISFHFRSSILEDRRPLTLEPLPLPLALAAAFLLLLFSLAVLDYLVFKLAFLLEFFLGVAFDSSFKLSLMPFAKFGRPSLFKLGFLGFGGYKCSCSRACGIVIELAPCVC